jgi:hypothetical protein
LTLPAATDTLVGKATTDTLTNKTLTSPTLTGVVTFDAGTAAAPAITTTGDTNTGIFFPAADTIAFAEGGAEVARFDSSGNFGLGVTPSAFGGGYKAFEVNAGSISATTGAGNLIVSNNSYFNGTNFIYKATGVASDHVQTGGQHWFRTAASGTAGNAISFTQAMTLDASGNLGVGTTSTSAYRLNVKAAFTSGVAGAYIEAGEFNQSIMVLNHTNASVTSNLFQVQKSGTGVLTLDSSGNLLVGPTSVIGSKLGIQTQGGNGIAYLVRHTSATAGKYRIFAVDSSNNGLFYDQNNVGMYMADAGTSWIATSDESQKVLTNQFTGAIEFLSTVRATRGRYKTDDESISRSFLIAQDWQEYLPEAISEKDGILGLSYQDTIPVLVKAIQELTARITALEGA